MNWDKRLSWGGAGTRKTSRFYPEAVVKRYGRVFYDAFYFDGKRVALHDCVGVALSEDDTTGAETSRVLELWEDTKGSRKGIKYFRGRWLFYPHHLPADHKEVKRKRTGLELRQVYEQCDAAANNDENVLASVRSLQRVLCCWKDSRNRVPSNEERQTAHAWFDSAWDDERREVVPLSVCVDKAGSARFALIRALEIVQPPTLAPASGEVAGGARTAAGAAASGAPEPLHKVATAAVQKVPAAAAAKPQPVAALNAEKQSAAPGPVAPPKAVAAAATAAVPVREPEAVHKSSAAAAAMAAPARKGAAPSVGAATAAEKRTSAPVVTAGAVPRAGLPAAATKQAEPALHGSKPDIAPPLLAKKPPSVGDKRSRQEEAVLTVDEVPSKRVAQQAQPEPRPQQPYRIPKLKQPAHDDGRAAGAAFLAPPARVAGGGVAPVAFEGPGPMLTSWTGPKTPRGCQIIRVSGLPLDMQHAEWKSLVKSVKLPALEASVSGWVLPSNTWHGSGTGYLLVREKSEAFGALKQLNGMALRCATTGLLRPLFADLCAASELTGDEPFIGHLELGDKSMRGRDPIVPHFVQSNTLELDMSLQWRALISTQYGAREGLRNAHVRELAQAIGPLSRIS